MELAHSTVRTAQTEYAALHAVRPRPAQVRTASIALDGDLPVNAKKCRFFHVVPPAKRHSCHFLLVTGDEAVLNAPDQHVCNFPLCVPRDRICQSIEFMFQTLTCCLRVHMVLSGDSHEARQPAAASRQ